jgi:hypothetical protein
LLRLFDFLLGYFEHNRISSGCFRPRTC